MDYRRDNCANWRWDYAKKGIVENKVKNLSRTNMTAVVVHVATVVHVFNQTVQRLTAPLFI